MTREDAINAMAREIALAGNPDATWDWYSDSGRSAFIREATAALDAMEPHIQAERGRVRGVCLMHADAHLIMMENMKAEATREDYQTACSMGILAATQIRDAIRAMDIGGDDG